MLFDVEVEDVSVDQRRNYSMSDGHPCVYPVEQERPFTKHTAMNELNTSKKKPRKSFSENDSVRQRRKSFVCRTVLRMCDCVGVLDVCCLSGVTWCDVVKTGIGVGVGAAGGVLWCVGDIFRCECGGWVLWLSV